MAPLRSFGVVLALAVFVVLPARPAFAMCDSACAQVDGGVASLGDWQHWLDYGTSGWTDAAPSSSWAPERDGHWVYDPLEGWYWEPLGQSAWAPAIAGVIASLVPWGSWTPGYDMAWLPPQPIESVRPRFVPPRISSFPRRFAPVIEMAPVRSSAARRAAPPPVHVQTTRASTPAAYRR